MIQSTESRLATQELIEDQPVVRLRPDMRGELRVILATARVEESENLARTLQRAPETQPGEWKIARLMLEQLERDGEINFHDFSRNEERIRDEFGHVSVDYESAVRRFLAHLELAPA